MWNIYSFHQMINNHDRKVSIINQYLQRVNSLDMNSLYMCPKKVKLKFCLQLGFHHRLWRRNHAIYLGMATWSLCAIVISNAYRGTLISNLLTTRPTPKVNSLKELTTSSLGWVIRRGTYLESTFLVLQCSLRLKFIIS